jgi:hypothetical protein
MPDYPRERFDYSSPFTRPKLKLPGKGRDRLSWSTSRNGRSPADGAHLDRAAQSHPDMPN